MERCAGLHGGQLEITSEVNRGTAVTVRLPKERLRVPAPAVSVVERAL
jgi:signal transduction histidine kinase